MTERDSTALRLEDAAHSEEIESATPTISSDSVRHAVHLVPPQGSSKDKKRPGRLARLVGLELYSGALLTRKVRVELTVLAALLLGIFFFEFGAWSFFFNGIFVGDMFRLHPVGTASALLFALLFAGVIFFFEWQMITADTRRLSPKDKKNAQRIRVVAILVAGFIVAHAVDILAFAKPVAKVLHLEAVRDEVFRLDQELQALANDERQQQRDQVSEDLGIQRSRLESARENRRRALADQGQYRQEVDLLQREFRQREADLQSAERRWIRLQAIADPAAVQIALQEVQAAKRRRDNALTDLRIARGNLGAASESLQEADRVIEELTATEGQLLAERAEHTERAVLLQATVEKLQNRLRDWKAHLDQADPGQNVYVETGDGWGELPETVRADLPLRWKEPLRFTSPEPTFFDKIHVIYELAKGKFWPSQKHRVGLPEYLPEDEARGVEPSLVYFSSLLGVHLAAIFVPFLVFAVKWFLLSKDVDSYFSVWHQAYAGDPDARLILSTEQKVQKRKDDGYW